MRATISILLLSLVLLRPFLPFINYAINYEYISSVLCENREKPELLCNGKCYLKKDLAKSSQSNTAPKELKIEILYCFVIEKKIKITNDESNNLIEKKAKIQQCFNFEFQDFYQEFFHPPRV